MTQPVWQFERQDNRFLVGKLLHAPQNAVLCFSMLAPVKAVSGCKRINSIGGYTEILVEGGALFSITFEDDDFDVLNRGWLPVNPYLDIKGQNPVAVAIDFTMPVEPPLDPVIPIIDNNLRLVPAPQNWAATGEILEVGQGFNLVGQPLHSDAVIAVEALAQRNRLGKLLDGETALHIEIDTALGLEAYELRIQPDGVVISASSRKGVFYAAISLLTLHINYAAKIPCGTLKDAPRFSWRGQQLDCARHYFQPENLMELLDLLALLKLNKFHWHFSDDEAFRLEVTCFPEIWQKTRLRGEGQLMPAVFGGRKEPTGGSYSLDFAKELINRATALEIDVLPEIEIPAHGYALTRIFPQLRDPHDNTEESSVQGYKGNTMNPAMPFMWDFVEALTREIASIFPFAHIHLGCDERPPDAWKNSPKARALMAEHGLKTLDDLQGWSMEKVAAMVTDLGCRPCAWEEAAKGANGGIGHDAILFSWSGQGPGLAAARQGYNVVMCPAAHTYLDMTTTTRFDEYGARWAGAVPLEATVDWAPVPPDEPELERKILGVEGAFWAEFATGDSYMKSMLVPRILGIAESGWRTAANPATTNSIRASAVAYDTIFKKSGWAK